MIEIIASILGILIDFLLIAGLVKLASIIFDFTFTWTIAVFIWLLIGALQDIFGKRGD